MGLMKPVKLLGNQSGTRRPPAVGEGTCALDSLSTFAAIQSQRTIPPSFAFSERVRDDMEGRGCNFFSSCESNLLRGDA